MNDDTPLADLAAEYEKTAEMLQAQITEIDAKLKKVGYGAEYTKLTHTRASLQAIFYEVRGTAFELRNYYNK